MKKIALLITLLFAIFAFANANPLIDTITDFTDVDNLVKQKIEQYGASEVLIVLDIDNTILTSHVDLGGDIWFQWQKGKLNILPTEEQKIKKCFYNDVIGMLNELGTMDLVDASIPKIINNWQNSKITLIALTSRSPRVIAPTERELVKKEIDFTKTPIESTKPVFKYNYNSKISYTNGIMMTTGKDKGVMLDSLLAVTGKSFRAIVFVDDTEDNINNVNRKFADKSVDLTLFYYTKVIDDRKKANGGKVLTSEQVEKMANDWEKLNTALDSIYPDRNKCVNPDYK